MARLASIGSRSGDNLAVLFAITVFGVWLRRLMSRPLEKRMLTFDGWDIAHSIALAAAIFPVAYRSVVRHLQRSSTHTALRYFVAFQNGFFWESVLERIV